MNAIVADQQRVTGCADCPFNYDGRWSCHHPNAPADHPTGFAADPPWCPLAKKPVLVFMVPK